LVSRLFLAALNQLTDEAIERMQQQGVLK